MFFSSHSDLVQLHDAQTRLCVRNGAATTCVFCCVQLNAKQHVCKIHPSIFFFSTQLIHLIAYTPGTSRQFMAGPRRDKQAAALTHTHTAKLHWPLTRIIISELLDCYFTTSILCSMIGQFYKIAQRHHHLWQKLCSLTVTDPCCNSERVRKDSRNKITLWISRLSLVKWHGVMKCNASNSPTVSVRDIYQFKLSFTFIFLAPHSSSGCN